MAINSSSPVSAAAALSGKGASGTDTKGKLPAYGPGTPAYPPERLPAQPLSGTPQASPPAAGANPGAAATQASPAGPAAPGAALAASADSRGQLPATNPFPLTLSSTTTAASSTPAQSAPAPAASPVRARPKAALSAQLPDATTAPAVLLAGASPEPAPAAAPADSGAPAAAPADPASALPAALAGIATDPPVDVQQHPAARGPIFQAATPDEGEPDASPTAPATTGPVGPLVSDPGHPVPVKLAVSTDPQAGDPSPRSLETPTNSADTPADPGVTGFDVAAARLAANPPVTAAPVPVQTPVGASGWTDEVGTHVIWMAHQGVSSASLRLQPEHLGPLEVKISLHDTTASVWFGANEPETRTALQAALPQLKEMFAAQGMTLTDAGVSREPPRHTQLPRGATHASGAPATPVLEASAVLPGVRRGLIDTYA